LIFYAKNLEVTKTSVIFENEHDKNQTKMAKIGWFWVWKMPWLWRPQNLIYFSKNIEGLKLQKLQNLHKYCVIIKFLFFQNNHSDLNFNWKFDYEFGMQYLTWDPKILGVIDMWSLFRGHLCSKILIWDLKIVIVVYRWSLA